jgi:uncharacterized protein (UPF0332 family)
MLTLVREDVEPYLSKARECLAGAQSELANSRYNNAANRAYYAAYNGAIVALIRAGYRSSRWGHGEVQAAFARELLHRRKIYPSPLARLLSGLATMRNRGDYGRTTTSEREASKIVSDAEGFLVTLLGIEP